MRYRQSGVAHAIELVGGKRLNHVFIKRVAHVVKLGVDLVQGKRAAERGNGVARAQLHHVLHFAQAAHVIGVAMREKQLVNGAYVFANELMTRIGRRIDKQRAGGEGVACGKSQLRAQLIAHAGGACSAHHNAAVTAANGGVLARFLADGAVAEEGGNAASGSGSHKREDVLFHVCLAFLRYYVHP